MGTAIDLDEINEIGLTQVYKHPEAKVDIVLVHGLNGDPRKTWTSKKKQTFWPTQLLPENLATSPARILVYGYNADVYTFGSKSASSDMIHEHAQTMVTSLVRERKARRVEGHPIIFVAHSLGGILVKRALELSFDVHSLSLEANRSIMVATFGILFLGTPHNGADAAKWGSILQGMVHTLVPKKMMHSESQLVKTLESNNETLKNINLHFLDIYQKFKICMAHEESPTDLKGTKSFIVDKDSAAPLLPDVEYFGIAADHSNMCKFDSDNSPGYMNVSGFLVEWVEQSPGIIRARIEEERRSRMENRRAQAEEIIRGGGYPSMTPRGSSVGTPDRSKSMEGSTITLLETVNIPPFENQKQQEDPLFIKPSGFRANSLFVGRQDDLAELHKMLTDNKRREVGTSAVLIHAIPGGGKSHLARQYVYEYKKEYPGGIFWLRAKSSQELALGYWEIARKAALKDLGNSADDDSPPKESQKFIKTVKKWLNHRRKWLLVLDGIHFNDDSLHQFIPDSIDTALIYTSTEKSVSGDHFFLNPQIIRLPYLSAVEARNLLLLELDKKEPFSQEDLNNSMQLVQAMGFLPVVIHAVAQRLKSTDEPLGKYARNYSNEPRLRGIGAYKVVLEQLRMLGANEALNLIYILCFFSQHVPVEMISLGTKALEPYHIPVKKFEPVSGHSLNNTFKDLNRFALIERNEHELSMHASLTSRGSQEMLADNVDVIRLHSVVQGFFFDTLLAKRSLPVWLDHAVRVFTCSYDMANERIKQKPHAGLVEDYRLYEVHGIRIGEHLTKTLSKRLFDDERIMLEEAKGTLDSRLQAIKSEIERRTPESSSVIVEGHEAGLQISIFDRTSSSSDTGPETPGQYDPWPLDPQKLPTDSPVDYTGSVIPFPPMPQDDDTGYDSDRESLGTMRFQNSQQTVRQDSPNSPDGLWTKVENRRRPRVNRMDYDRLHRSIRQMEEKRYRDSAGAFRVVNGNAINSGLRAIDPRVSRKTAAPFFDHSSGHEPPRGRNSTQSGAEAALAEISKSSPPPARGGGLIQDRRSTSLRGSGRVLSGIASYAAAVSGSGKDTSIDMARPTTAKSSADSTSTLENWHISALESLQKFPAINPPSPNTLTQSPLPMPPYPQTPQELNPAISKTYYPSEQQNYHKENITPAPDLFPSREYPRMTGPIPFETRQTAPSRNADYLEFSDSVYPYLSLSSPDIRLQREASDKTYFPGRPELSNQKGGYTSQPMSRDQSGNSQFVGEGRRRSIAETEPLPELPTFSPRLGPTTYQTAKKQMDDVELERMKDSVMGGVGGKKEKSPRLEYARAALIERIDEWNSPPSTTEDRFQSAPQRQFNPNAPPFSPHSFLSSTTSSASLQSSPNLPVSAYNDSRPRSVSAGSRSAGGGAEMGRSSSAGLKVGGRVIEFGDFPEKVDADAARERVLRSWNERERLERENRESSLKGSEQNTVGLGIQDLK